jgi:hypothetical protein
MRHIVYTIGLTLCLIATVGCGSKKGIGSPAGTPVGSNPDLPPVTDPDPNLPTNGGATIALTGVDAEVLSDYVGWTVATPTDINIVGNLKEVGTYSRPAGGVEYAFGGRVSIKFKEGTTSYTDEFTSMPFGSSYNTVTGVAANNTYNRLSSDYPELGGKIGYHGFFEDTRVQRLVAPMPYSPIFGGAIILVIDQTNDAGDGQGPTLANGSVYFKNFLGQYPMGPLPNTHCWFISSGPYDCRSWKSGNSVNTKASIYPDNGYVKLGSFTGLDIKKAFNDEI